MEANQSHDLIRPKFETFGPSPMVLYPWPMHFAAPIALPPTQPAPLQGKKYKRTWSREQVEELYTATKRHSATVGKEVQDLDIADFKEIAKCVCRTPRKCMSKVMEIQASGTLRSGVWAPDEDSLLQSCLTNGKKKWGAIANEINTACHKGLRIRTGKQCKERWNNHLNPCINRGEWTAEDDLKLLESHKRLGNKWSMIAKELNSRTDSSIKNRIKSLLNKEKQNVDLHGSSGDILDVLILRKRHHLEQNREEKSTSSSEALHSFSTYAAQVMGEDVSNT